MDDNHETHLGWQSSEIDSHEGPDHLVIDGSYVKEPDVQNNAVISFDAPVQQLDQQAQDKQCHSKLEQDARQRANEKWKRITSEHPHDNL